MMWENIHEMFPENTLESLDMEYSSIEDVVRQSPKSIEKIYTILNNECYVGTEKMTWYADGTVNRELLDTIYPREGFDGITALNAYGWKMINNAIQKQTVYLPRYIMDQLAPDLPQEPICECQLKTMERRKKRSCLP